MTNDRTLLKPFDPPAGGGTGAPTPAHWARRSFLANLDEESRTALQNVGRPRLYPAGMALVRQGEPPTHVLALLRGSVKVVTAQGRGELVLAVRSAGDLAGELSAVDGEPRAASVVALETVAATAVPMTVFEAFLEERPQAVRALLAATVQRLRDAQQQRAELNGLDVRRRVARQLAALASRIGPPAGGGPLEVRLAQRELAQLVGCSREAVARSLTGLRRRGLVGTSHRSITVLDLDGLRQL